MIKTLPLYLNYRHLYQWIRIAILEWPFEMQSSDLDIGLLENVVVDKEQECLDTGLKHRRPSIVPSRSGIGCVRVAPHVVLLYHALWKVRLI